MPSELPNNAQRLLAFFGNIQQGTFERQNTAQIWESINAQVASTGTKLWFGAANAVGTLRTYAVQSRTAMEGFAAAADEDGIESKHVFQPPWMADTSGAVTPPKYRVRFELVTTDDEGNETTEWKVYNTSRLPSTKGGLMDDLEATGKGLAEEYNQSFSAIGRVLIEQS